MIKLLRLIFTVVPKLIFEYFSWIRKYAKNKDDYPISLRFYKVQKLVRYVVEKFKINLINSRIENLYTDEKKFLIVCNHQSMFDPLILIANAKRPLTFISKKEVEKFIFVGKVIKIIDGEFLDRENLKQQVKVIMRIEKLLQNNLYDVVIFPEGKRNHNYDKKLLEFHPGSFKVPFKAQCDLVVCELYGTFRCLKLLKYRKSNQPVQFNYLKRIKYDELSALNSVELKDECYNLINNDIPRLVKIDNSIKY